MKRIFFIQVQVQCEPELQLFRTLRKKTGGYCVLEDIARKSHRRFGNGGEIQTADAAESIAAWKEPNLVRTKTDGFFVTVGRLVPQAQFHRINYDIPPTPSRKIIYRFPALGTRSSSIG